MIIYLYLPLFATIYRVCLILAVGVQGEGRAEAAMRAVDQDSAVT